MPRNIGEFAGSFADAFTRIRSQNAEQKRQDEMAKLQGKLVQLQIEAQDRKGAAQQSVADFSGGIERSPGGRPVQQFDFQPDVGDQIGEVQPAGMGLMEMLADPGATMALLQSDMLDVGDLVGSNSPNRTLELLTAAGIDPSSEQGQELISSHIGGDSTGLEDVMAQTQLFQAEERLQKQRNEREKTEKTESQRIAGTKVSIRNDFKHAKEIIEIQQRLEETANAVGIPYGDFIRNARAGGAAMLSMVGFDMSRSREIIADRDRLDKLFADGILESVDRLSGTMTNQKLDAITSATPNVNNSASANGLLIADNLQAVLDGAEVEQMDVEERQEMEEFISFLGTLEPGGQGEAIINVKAIAKMTKSQLEDIAASGKQLSEEARVAAETRWDELNARR